MELRFYMPTQVLMGEDCVKNQAAELAKLGQRALVVTGARSARQNGSLADLEAALAANGQSMVLFDKVMENPTIDCVYEGAELARGEGADFVVGIGGGSPMDASKAIAWIACEDVPREALFAGRYEKRLPLCCIPTTAGTGSEVTQYSVLTNDALKTKTSLGSPVLFADLALLDSRYMDGLPHTTMVNTVVDSLSHSVEGYISRRANAVSDALVLEAVGIIGRILPRLAADALTGADRAELLYASTLGGMVIAHTGTTAVHAMGYPLTYFKHTAHGRANGLLLPAYLEKVAARRPDRAEPVLAALGMADLGALQAALDGLLPGRESLTLSEAEDYADTSMKTSNVKNCVVALERDELVELYCKVFDLR